MHTPGPWIINRETEENLINIEPGIGCAYGLGKTPEANARLIAAAPELLSACEAMRDAMAFMQKHDRLPDDTCPADLYDYAITAINKAVRP